MHRCAKACIASAAAVTPFSTCAGPDDASLGPRRGPAPSCTVPGSRAVWKLSGMCPTRTAPRPALLHLAGAAYDSPWSLAGVREGQGEALGEKAEQLIAQDVENYLR